MDEATSWLAAAAAALAWQTPLVASETSVLLARELALTTSTAALPARTQAEIDDFDQTGVHWPVPAGRPDAALALLRLCRNAELVNEQLWSQVEELASDPDPGVRWMVASSLNLARVAQPLRSWDLMLRMTSTETSHHVLEALLSSLVAFAPDHLHDVTSSIKQIYDRATSQTENPNLARSSANLLVEYWIWHGEPTGRILLDSWIEDIATHAELAGTTFFRLRGAVTYGDEGEPAAEVRARAIAMWADLVRAAWNALAPLEAKVGSGDVLSADERSVFAAVTQLLETAAMEVYFASGAFAERQASAADRLSAPARRRFYEEGDGIFEILTQVGVSAIAHHLVETLSTYVDMDPRGVLVRLDAVLQSGRAWGISSRVSPNPSSCASSSCTLRHTATSFSVIARAG